MIGAKGEFVVRLQFNHELRRLLTSFTAGKGIENEAVHSVKYLVERVWTTESSPYSPTGSRAYKLPEPTWANGSPPKMCSSGRWIRG